VPLHTAEEAAAALENAMDAGQLQRGEGDMRGGGGSREATQEKCKMRKEET
jgi:hypothetical protein